LFHCYFAGHGVFVSVEGDLYKGTFRNDISHGRGVYVWPDGQVYLGDYVDGVREGKGYVMRIAFTFHLLVDSFDGFLIFLESLFVFFRIETWPRGARYEGEYHRDQRNGLGEYTYPDGRRYCGEYKDDRLHGQGVQTDSDGIVLYEGQWTMGEFFNG
jgi:hypothetical protein